MHGGARIGAGRKPHAPAAVLGSDPFAVARSAAEKRKAVSAIDSDAKFEATDGDIEVYEDTTDQQFAEKRSNVPDETNTRHDFSDLGAEISSLVRNAFSEEAAVFKSAVSGQLVKTKREFQVQLDELERTREEVERLKRELEVTQKRVDGRDRIGSY